jgi:hypothetical protein
MTSKRRLNKTMTIVATAGLLLGTAAMAWAAAAKAPEKVTLDACKAKKSGVAFDHKKHAVDLKVACDKCHHTNKGLKEGDAVEVKKCSTCHLKPEKAETPACDSPSPTKNPFHSGCMGCHKDAAAKDAKKADLKKCTSCHK